MPIASVRLSHCLTGFGFRAFRFGFPCRSLPRYAGSELLIIGPPSNVGRFLVENPGVAIQRCTMQGGFLGYDLHSHARVRLPQFVIFCPDGSALVGSREDLLWERRDLIGNPAMGIVEAVKDFVQRRFETLCRHDRIAIYFTEVFGRNIGSGAKNYTKEGKVGFRLFDVVFIENIEEVFSWAADRIAHWRDNGGQRYVDADRLVQVTQEIGVEPVPPLFDTDASALPTELEATHRFLLSHEWNRCRLDEGASGVPEGNVVRSPDRSSIAKIRREDYERTLKRRRTGR